MDYLLLKVAVFWVVTEGVPKVVKVVVGMVIRQV